MNIERIRVIQEISRLKGVLESSLLHMGLVKELMAHTNELPAALVEKVNALEFEIQAIEEQLIELIASILTDERMGNEKVSEMFTKQFLATFSVLNSDYPGEHTTQIQ